MQGGLVQVVGIVPTLILVQVGMGRCVGDAQNRLGRTDYPNSKSKASKSQFTSIGPNSYPNSTQRSTLSKGIDPIGVEWSIEDCHRSHRYPDEAHTQEENVNVSGRVQDQLRDVDLEDRGGITNEARQCLGQADLLCLVTAS